MRSLIFSMYLLLSVMAVGGEILTVVKIIELVGYSTGSWQEAAENALKEAAKTIRNIVGMDVVGWTAKVENNKIASFKTNVKIAFVAERP